MELAGYDFREVRTEPRPRLASLSDTTPPPFTRNTQYLSAVSHPSSSPPTHSPRPSEPSRLLSQGPEGVGYYRQGAEAEPVESFDDFMSDMKQLGAM